MHIMLEQLLSKVKPIDRALPMASEGLPDTAENRGFAQLLASTLQTLKRSSKETPVVADEAPAVVLSALTPMDAGDGIDVEAGTVAGLGAEIRLGNSTAVSGFTLSESGSKQPLLSLPVQAHGPSGVLSEEPSLGRPGQSLPVGSAIEPEQAAARLLQAEKSMPMRSVHSAVSPDALPSTFDLDGSNSAQPAHILDHHFLPEQAGRPLWASVAAGQKAEGAAMPLSDAVQDERFADLPVSSLQEDGSEDAALVKLAGLPGGGTAQEGDGKVLSDEEIVPMVSAAEPEVALHDADSSLAMKPDAANLATGVQSEAPSDSVVRMDAEVSGGLSEERVASADEAVRAAEPRVASERSEMAAAHATAVKEAVPGQAQQGQTQQGQTQPGQTQQGQTQQGQTQPGQTQQGQTQQGQAQQGQTQQGQAQQGQTQQGQAQQGQAQQGQTQQGQTQQGQTQQGQTQPGQTQQGQTQQGQTQQGQAQQGQAQQGQTQQGQTQHAQPSQPTQGQAVQQQFLQMAQASAQQVQMTRQSSPEARGATAVSAEALNASNVSVEEMLSSALGADKRASLPQGLQSIGLPMTHPRWGQALGQRVVYMTNNQVQQAQITLNPDKLGPVQIKLHVDKDQQVHVVVTAQQGATREALENAMPRLKEMMQEAGVDLGSVNVGDQRESANQSQDKDGESHNRTSSASLEGVLTDTTDPSEGVTVGVSDTLVDYYA